VKHVMHHHDAMPHVEKPSHDRNQQDYGADPDFAPGSRGLDRETERGGERKRSGQIDGDLRRPCNSIIHQNYGSEEMKRLLSLTQQGSGVRGGRARPSSG
jgi:hypothetical protein